MQHPLPSRAFTEGLHTELKSSSTSSDFISHYQPGLLLLEFSAWVLQIGSQRIRSVQYYVTGGSGPTRLVLRIVGQVLVKVGQRVGVLAQVVVDHAQLVACGQLPERRPDTRSASQ